MAGCGLGQQPADLGEVEGEVGRPLPHRHAGAGDAGDVGVQGVGRLEDGDRPPVAAVGQAQGLEDLVRPVPHQDLLGPDAVQLADGGAQGRGLAVGVAVERRRRPAPPGTPPATPAAGGRATRWC